MSADHDAAHRRLALWAERPDAQQGLRMPRWAARKAQPSLRALLVIPAIAGVTDTASVSHGREVPP